MSVELRDEADGLHGAWHVSDIELGNEVVTLVRDGVPLGLSVGFVEGRNRWNRDRTRVERLSASLDHVAVVRTPAYDGARIHAVRTATENLGSPPIPGRSVAVPRLTVALLRR